MIFGCWFKHAPEQQVINTSITSIRDSRQWWVPADYATPNLKITHIFKRTAPEDFSSSLTVVYRKTLIVSKDKKGQILTVKVNL
jgi:hypothetical protein